MFKFLKEKLKKGISLFSKKIEESGEEEVIEEIKETSKEKKPEKIEKLKEKPKEEKKVKPESVKEDKKRIEKPKEKEKHVPKKEEKRPEKKPVPKKDEKKEITVQEKKKEVIKEEISEIERVKEEKVSPVPEKEPKKQGFFSKIFGKKEEKLELPEEIKEVPKIEELSKEPIPHLKEEKEEVAAEELEIEPRIKEDLAEEKEEILAAEELKEDEKAFSEPETTEAEEPKKIEAIKEESAETKEAVPEEEKSGFFEKIAQRIVTKKISNDKFEEMFWDLEIVMLENNVAVEVIEKIKLDLKNDIVDRPIRRNKIEETILHALKKSIDEILSSETINIFEKMKHKKPYVVCFFGVNGSGKTTTIAKMAKLMLDNKKKVVLAAADTFRAAAIDQLEIHANNLGVKLIKHDYGSDPAAVAFDAIKYAEAKDVDIVLIDTAGRLHSNTNLIDEMKKIVRVAKPDLKVFIGEAITGNDCIEQAVKFNEAVGVDAIILAKADIDEKGGASISVSYVTKKPILYLGVGQNYADIKQFDKDEIMAGLGLEE